MDNESTGFVSGLPLTCGERSKPPTLDDSLRRIQRSVARRSRSNRFGYFCRDTTPEQVAAAATLTRRITGEQRDD